VKGFPVFLARHKYRICCNAMGTSGNSLDGKDIWLGLNALKRADN
jgi:hypothetical protein